AGAGGRGGADVALAPGLVRQHHRSRRQALRGAVAALEPARVGGHVVRRPMPEARSRRGIRVEAGDREAERAGRRLRPLQRRMLVLTAAAGRPGEARQRAAGGEVGAGQLERRHGPQLGEDGIGIVREHGWPPSFHARPARGIRVGDAAAGTKSGGEYTGAVTDLAADRQALLDLITAEAVFHGDFTLSSGKKATY